MPVSEFYFIPVWGADFESFKHFNKPFPEQFATNFEIKELTYLVRYLNLLK